MYDDLSICGYGIKLRPVSVTDASFILAERLRPRALQYLGDTEDNESAQERWIRCQQKKPDDLYLLCETSYGEKIGTIGVYQISQHEAQWGRFIIGERYNAAVQCLSLTFDYCFQDLRLQKLCCSVVERNHKARALYEWTGHILDAPPWGPISIQGEEVRQIRYKLTAADWIASRDKVRSKAQRITLVR